jgi:hypothetical protein
MISSFHLSYCLGWVFLKNWAGVCKGGEDRVVADGPREFWRVCGYPPGSPTLLALN